MKRQLIIVPILIMMIDTTVIGQINYELPYGFSIYKSFEDKEQKIIHDFDKDGINDLVCLIENQDQDMGYAVFYLSHVYLKNRKYSALEIFLGPFYSLKFNQDKIEITSETGFGANASSSNYFHYQKDLEQFRLILKTSSFIHQMEMEVDVINLVTGKCIIDKIESQHAFEIITVDNYDEKMPQLLDVIYNN